MTSSGLALHGLRWILRPGRFNRSDGWRNGICHRLSSMQQNL